MSATPRAQIDLGRGRIAQLMCALDHPEHNLRVIHVAGTNGKGSTTQYIASLLRKSPHLPKTNRIATFTSPHLIEPWDAWQINGCAVDEPAYTQARSHALAHVHPNDEMPTEFEVGFASAIWYFVQINVDIAIIEVGMGGRTDATNVFRSKLPCNCPGSSKLLASVITRIGFDHELLLGGTIDQIANHKVGIMAQDPVPCIVGPQSYPDNVYNAIQQESQSIGCTRVYWVHLINNADLFEIYMSPHPRNGSAETDPDLELVFSVPGSTVLGYQVYNVATALVTVAQIGHLPGSKANILNALQSTQWPGRLHWLSPDSTLQGLGTSGRVLIDGAHNLDGAKYLRSYLDTLQPMPIVWILGMSKGKNAENVIRALVHQQDTVVCAGFSPVAQMPWVQAIEDLAQHVRATGTNVLGTVNRVWDIPVNWYADAELVVVAGSLYLVADVYRWFQKNRREELWDLGTSSRICSLDMV